ncbi:MAG TPA: hypothetical protein DFR83_10905, partial [Deltaproteobacteria bacterium]|nr:hypothetical protein [Deltaproteobacteria bacterium]
ARSADAVSYDHTLAKHLTANPSHWRDPHELWFYVEHLCLPAGAATDELRTHTHGRAEHPAIVVITADKGNTPRWQRAYGSRATATRTLVAALGTNHAGSVHVHPTTGALTFKVPGDGDRPNRRSRFVILLRESLSEAAFHALLAPLKQGETP